MEDARESYHLKQHPVPPPGDLRDQSNGLLSDPQSGELAARDGNESLSSSDEEQEPVCSGTIPSASWGELFCNGHYATRGDGGGGGEDDDSALDLKAGSFLWNLEAAEFVPSTSKS